MFGCAGAARWSLAGFLTALYLGVEDMERDVGPGRRCEGGKLGLWEVDWRCVHLQGSPIWVIVCCYYRWKLASGIEVCRALSVNVGLMGSPTLSQAKVRDVNREARRDSTTRSAEAGTARATRVLPQSLF